MDLNPYQAPGYAPPPGPFPQTGADAQPAALFTPNAIALAAFLGSPLAATALYAWNLRRQGRSPALAILLGLGATTVVFALAFTLPDKLTNLVTLLNFGLIAAVRAVAQRDFGPAVAHAGQFGIAPKSTWWAAGVALGCLVPIGALLFAAVTLTEQSITVAPEQTITFEGDATERDARAVAADLVELGFFGPESPNAKTATLGKTSSGFTLAFYVDESGATDPKNLAAFTCVGGYVRSHALAKTPTSVLLLNDFGLEKKRLVAPLDTEVAYATACGTH